MIRTHYQVMFRAMRWADERVIAGLRNCPEAHAEGLPLMCQVLAAESIWLMRINQEQPRLGVWPQLDLSECESLVVENATGYAALLDRMSEADFETKVIYLNSTGKEFADSVFDILTQVITHGPYHRGQIAKLLGRNEVQPPVTDYIAFTRSVETAAA